MQAEVSAADSGDAPDAGSSAIQAGAPSLPGHDAGNSTPQDEVLSEPRPDAHEDGARTEPRPDAGSPALEDDAGTEPPVVWPAICPNGVVDTQVVRVSSAAELAQLRGCEGINGRLLIETYDIRSLRDLASLRWTGSLVIVDEWNDSERRPSMLESLEGLEGLRSVAGIQLSRLPVSSLRLLSQAANFSSVIVEGLNALEDCSGLEQMHPNTIELTDNAQLRSVAGLNFENAHVITLGGLPKFTDISFVSQASYSGLILRLGQLSGLKDLSSLRGTRHLGALHIERWNEIRDLTGLENLESLSGIYLSELPQLRSLAGLKPSAGLPSLWIRHSPLFESFAEFFTNFDHTSSVRLYNLPALKTLAPLRTLRAIEYLLINRCDGLRDLSGLEQMQPPSYFDLGRNAQLQSLQALERFWSPPNCIAVYANPNLPISEVEWLAARLTVQRSMHTDWMEPYPACEPFLPPEAF